MATGLWSRGRLKRENSDLGTCESMCSSEPASVSDAESYDLSGDGSNILLGPEAVAPHPPLKRRCRRSGETKPSRRSLNQASTYTDGPETFTEIFQWAENYVALFLQDTAVKAALLHKVKNRLYLSTDYSGSGCVEQAARMIREALQKEYDQEQFLASSEVPWPDIPSPIKVFHSLRACDLDTVCAQVLRMHDDGPEQPDCVFGDILDRAEPHVLEGLRRIEMPYKKKWDEEFAQRADGPRKKSPGSKAVRKELVAFHRSLGSQMMEDMVQFMEGACILSADTPAFKHDKKAFCSRHQRDCRVHAEVPSSAVKVVVAGNSCDDWSSMGSQSGWLGSGVVPFLLWLYETRAQHPDFIVQECTPRFMEDILNKVLDSLYTTQVIEISPMDLGIPSNRPRKWTISSLKVRWTYKCSFNSTEFKSFVYRKLALYGDVFFNSAPEEVLKYYEVLASRSMVPFMGNVSDEYIKCGYRKRLRDYRHLAVSKHRFQISPVLVCNLHQNPSSNFPQMMEDVPTLMCKTSSLYLLRSPGQGANEKLDVSDDSAKFREGRLLLADEALQVMGWPLFKPESCALTNVLPLLSDESKRSLAGNGMNIAVAGTMLLWIMGFATERVQTDMT